MNQRQYRQAVDAGEAARRAGRDRKSPMYAMGRDGELLREAWYQGYDDEDARIKAERKR